SGGNLSGCSATTTTGVAAFTGCKIDKAGNGYTLVATDSTDSLTSPASNAFNITVGPASQLVFTTQPTGGSAGYVFGQPVITLQDAGGNTVTTDISRPQLSITTGTPTSGGPGTLSGCVGTNTAGVVTYSGCKIDQVGTGYKLRATDGLKTADSAAFDINSPPPPAGSNPPAPPAGSTSSATASSNSPTGTATATNAGTTVSASGKGAFTVAQYGSDPVGLPTFGSSGQYFDVHVALGSSFTALTITDCNLNGGNNLQWFNPSVNGGAGAWQQVVGAPGPTFTDTSPPCVMVTLGPSTAPSLAQLTGTVFGVSGAPATPPTTPPVTPPVTPPTTPPTTPPPAASGYW
ncbi:MAG: hypothetical protein ACRD0E_12580, partial [Acidimicrobiales bacterium]